MKIRQTQSTNFFLPKISFQLDNFRSVQEHELEGSKILQSNSGDWKCGKNENHRRIIVGSTGHGVETEWEYKMLDS